MSKVIPRGSRFSHAKMTQEERRNKVANMYAQGHVMFTIAEIIGCGEETVRRDLDYIRRVWAEERGQEYNDRIMREIVGLEMQESALWEAWYNSCKEEIIHTVQQRKQLIAAPSNNGSRTPGGANSRKPTPPRLTVTEENTKTVRKQLIGDPRFMAEITRVRELRCKLLGLLEDEPVKSPIINIWQQLVEAARLPGDEIEERLQRIESLPVLTAGPAEAALDEMRDRVAAADAARAVRKAAEHDPLPPSVPGGLSSTPEVLNPVSKEPLPPLPVSRMIKAADGEGHMDADDHVSTDADNASSGPDALTTDHDGEDADSASSEDDEDADSGGRTTASTDDEDASSEDDPDADNTTLPRELRKGATSRGGSRKGPRRKIRPEDVGM
jgi:hypothetical protein